jgi:hypothetical protein
MRTAFPRGRIVWLNRIYMCMAVWKKGVSKSKTLVLGLNSHAVGAKDGRRLPPTLPACPIHKAPYIPWLGALKDRVAPGSFSAVDSAAEAVAKRCFEDAWSLFKSPEIVGTFLVPPRSLNGSLRAADSHDCYKRGSLR